MKIAILISGHIKSYDKYENINKNLINVLMKENHECFTFSSIWSNRKINEECKINMQILEKNSTVFEIESDKTQEFIEKYKNDKWKEYSHLLEPETCGKSIAMWYKVEKCYNLMQNYEHKYNLKFDYIFRLRPDIFFEDKFKIKWFQNIKANEIAMANWTGKYEIVSHRMMVQFSFGKAFAMRVYCSIYSNIKNIIERNDSAFTIEGFLYSQMKHYRVAIKRVPIQYYLVKGISHFEKMT